MDYEESLMIKIAWYYYFENMTQQSVANMLGISRMRVIKLLRRRARPASSSSACARTGRSA
jgi:DNA-binding transcriptional regulator LsrR (DeoR family)